MADVEIAESDLAPDASRPSFLDKREPVLASKTFVAGPGIGQTPGLVEPGNIDLTNRPNVLNADGSHSSVRSMSFSEGGPEILVPTVSDDGRIMTDDEAMAQFRKTGRHLGKFDNPRNATSYASRLHRQQAAAGPGGSAKQVPQHVEISEADLAPAAAPAPKATPGVGMSAAKGAVQGATLGFGDEIQAAGDFVASKVPGLRTVLQALNRGGGAPIDNPALTYQQRRDAYRANDKAAQAANPVAFGAGELAGGVAVPVLGVGAGGGVVRTLARGAALGGVGALGNSEADLTKGDVANAAKDAATGTVGGLVMGALGKGTSKAAGGALDRVTRATHPVTTAVDKAAHHLSGPGVMASVLHGNPTGIAAAIAAPFAAKGVAKGLVASDKAIANMLLSAEHGNPRARAILQAAGRLPNAAAQLTGQAVADGK